MTALNEHKANLTETAILTGNMEEYTKLTGGPFTIEGTVLDGNKLGRTIGIPTINQVPAKDSILPPFGVYFSEVVLNGHAYKGITNIGHKPTVNPKDTVTVETYIYNFNQTIYGSYATVKLYHFRRPEMKFADISQLKAQMKQDIEAGAAYRIQ